MKMMDNLPTGWVISTLGEICSKPQYGWTSKASHSGILRYVRTTDISNGKINWEKVPFCSKIPDDTEKYRVQINDILVSRAGSVGVSYRIKKVPFDAVFASYLIRFKPIQNIDPRYIEYYLKSYEYWKSISDSTAGIAIPNVNASKLSQLKIPVAPFNEQHHIVAKLEKLLQKVDACKERLDKIPAILKRFRHSILAAACSGRLTADWREKNPDVKPASEPFNKNSREEKNTKNELPALDVSNLPELSHTWKWHRIANLFKVVTGTTPPKKDKDNFSADKNDCPFFKPTDLDAGYLTEVSREYISKKGEKYCRILPPETVAVTSIGATIGKTGRLMIRSTTNQQINSILPTKNIIALYTFFYCNSEYFQKRIIEASSSTTLPIINKTRFGLLEYPLPPFAEQHEIVHRVEALFKIADQIEERYQKARSYVDKLTQSILAKAFRGELVPQDPNDEPATVLIERIREERSERKTEMKNNKKNRRQNKHKQKKES